MVQRIYHTKKYALASALLLFLWMVVATTLAGDDMLMRFPVLQKLESVLNISLLISLVLFLFSLTLIFRKRPLLQGSERGLYLHLSRRNRGVIPWRYISHFECSADHRNIFVYLQGAWDVPEGCGEQFDIQFNEHGKRMIVLPLHRKVGKIERVCNVLGRWHTSFVPVTSTTSPDLYEAGQRRSAAMSARGLTLLLLPLYFIRSKFWFLAAVIYLLLSAALEVLTDLTRPWVLAISAVPALVIIILLRRSLPKAIRALERRREQNNTRRIGL